MYSFLPALPDAFNEKRKKQILRTIKKKKISGLTHFTHIENLKSILTSGILPRAVIKGNKAFSRVKLVPTQMPESWQRLVPLNVSFPDYKLFAQMQNHDLSEWVVLIIDPKVIAETPAYFFPARAIDFINLSKIPGQKLTDFQSSSAWNYLFTDQVGAKRVELGIPEDFPTNPYTEVLTFFPIAPQSILQIHFYSDYKFNQWVLSNTEFAIRQDKNRWAAGLQFFSPRSDSLFWKTPRMLP